MKTLTIYDIKRLTEQTAPYFFTRNTLKFWGQTLKDFKVYKDKEKGMYYIWAMTKQNTVTERWFNPETNELELVK